MGEGARRVLSGDLRAFLTGDRVVAGAEGGGSSFDGAVFMVGTGGCKVIGKLDTGTRKSNAYPRKSVPQRESS